MDAFFSALNVNASYVPMRYFYFDLCKINVIAGSLKDGHQGIGLSTDSQLKCNSTLFCRTLSALMVDYIKAQHIIFSTRCFQKKSGHLDENLSSHSRRFVCSLMR